MNDHTDPTSWTTIIHVTAAMSGIDVSPMGHATISLGRSNYAPTVRFDSVDDAWEWLAAIGTQLAEATKKKVPS